MQEQYSVNCNNIIDDKELYSLCADIVYNKNFSVLGEVNRLLEIVNAVSSITSVLLFYIYYIMLKPNERFLVFNIKNFVIEKLDLLMADKSIAACEADYERIKKIETPEEICAWEISNLILHKYNPKVGISIPDFDYSKVGKMNELIYKTEFDKLSDIFIYSLCLWYGLYLDESTLLSDYQKDILDINLYRLVNKLPNPETALENQLKQNEIKEQQTILDQAESLNLID